MNKTSISTVMNVGCYVRVSTENQLENYSIEEQTERLKAYCKAKGWNIYKIYTDGGYSGSNTNRPALKQMLQAIHDKKINLVVVYKLDRLSRSQKDTLTLIEDEFLKNDVDFVSVNENFDTSTPFGRAMIGILSVFAQLEKDQITERFTMGRIARTKAGYFHGGPNIPFGYKYINGELIVDEIKAPQVQEVFDRFLKGYSVNSISRYANTKFGWRCSHPHILHILKNSVYIGKVKFGGEEYDGVHKPLVSKEVFFKTQELLNSDERESKKSSSQKTPFRAGFMLSGLIECSKCGAKYCAVHGFYRCYSRSKCHARYIIDPDCKNKNWPINELDAVIVDEIRSLALSPEKADKLWEDHKGTKEPINTKAINDRIKEINAQTARLIDLYQVGGIPMEQVREKIGALDSERSGLEEKLTPQAQLNQKSKEDFVDRIKQIVSNFEHKTVDEKRMIIGSIVDTIKIDDETLEIVWRI